MGEKEWFQKSERVQNISSIGNYSLFETNFGNGWRSDLIYKMHIGILLKLDNTYLDPRMLLRPREGFTADSFSLLGLSRTRASPASSLTFCPRPRSIVNFCKASRDIRPFGHAVCTAKTRKDVLSQNCTVYQDFLDLQYVS